MIFLYFLFLLFYTVPFKFDMPSSDDVVSVDLKSIRTIPEGITCLQFTILKHLKLGINLLFVFSSSS